MSIALAALSLGWDTSQNISTPSQWSFQPAPSYDFASNYYFGGMIRSMKVAHMAQALCKTCTPHMFGGGLG